MLHDLIASGRVRVRPGLALGAVPWVNDVRPRAERWRGMFLGLAIGNGLGNTSESMTPDARQDRHGEITHYLSSHFAGGRHVGLPSDDTQLCAWAASRFSATDPLIRPRG